MAVLLRRLFALWLAVSLALAPAAAFAGSYPVDEFAISEIDLSRLPQAALLLHTPDFLPPGALAVEEDGRPVPRFALWPVEHQTGLDVSLAVVFDNSGSMAGTPIEAARSGLALLLESLSSGSEVAVFPLPTSSAGPLFGRSAGVRARLGEIRAGGDTALFDAMVQAARWVSARPGYRCIVLLTDGRENASRATEQEATAAVIQAGAAFMAVGYTGAEGTDAALLERLARATGGQYVETAQAGRLADIFTWMRGRISPSYRLRLVLPDVRPGLHYLGVTAVIGGKLYAARRDFRILASGQAAEVPGPVLAAARPPDGFWNWFLAVRQSRFFAGLYRVPAIGKVAEFAGSLFLGVGENGQWSWASVAAALAADLLLLVTFGGGAAARAGLAGTLEIVGEQAGRRRLLSGAFRAGTRFGRAVDAAGVLLDAFEGYFGEALALAGEKLAPRLAMALPGEEFPGALSALRAAGRAWDLALRAVRVASGGVGEGLSMLGEAAEMAEKSARLPRPVREAAGGLGNVLRPFERAETVARLKKLLRDTFARAFKGKGES